MLSGVPIPSHGVPEHPMFNTIALWFAVIAACAGVLEAASAGVSAGSSFVETQPGEFELALDPGAVLSNAAIELTDTENDPVTVLAVTLQSAAPLQMAAPSLPPSGHPVLLEWTGKVDGGDHPGDYTWAVEFVDAGSGAPVTVTVTIRVNDVLPTHVRLNTVAGEGTASNPYAWLTFAGDIAGQPICFVSDANAGQALALTTVVISVLNPYGGSGFEFEFAGGVLVAKPPGTLKSRDVGIHRFTVTIAAGGQPVVIEIEIHVYSPLGHTIEPDSTLPNGHPGEPYSVQLTVSEPTGPFTWSLIFGTLPDGLSLNPTTGEITGTPTQIEEQTFAIEAASPASSERAKVFLLRIVDPHVTTPNGRSPNGNNDNDSGCVVARSQMSLWAIGVSALLAFAGIGLRARRS
jgi:hypothetical protein